MLYVVCLVCIVWFVEVRVLGFFLSLLCFLASARHMFFPCMFALYNMSVIFTDPFDIAEVFLEMNKCKFFGVP